MTGRLQSNSTSMRRFHLHRLRDETGVSGTGKIAEGVEWSDGTCTLVWLGRYKSTGAYPNIKEMMRVHGHDNTTQLHWIDGPTTHVREAPGETADPPTLTPVAAPERDSSTGA